MFSHFFIERPIFASVLSIVITLAGAVAVFNLPVAQYPQITPPVIMVMCNYPGANAKVVAESVAAPIEQQVNGVENMIYMSSNSANDGSYSLSVTFKPGVNLNFAQVLVQNRVNLALPLLPDVVKQAGVTTRKRNPDILLIVSMYSPDGRYDPLYVSNYATIKIKDELARVDGIGDVFLFGAFDYSMRIWLDPHRLALLGLTASDVLQAVREQNKQVAAGHFGQQPSGETLQELTIATLGRLSDPEQFNDVILRSTADGRAVRLRDVGQAAMEARNQDISSKLDGLPCTSVALFQLPYANALATAAKVRARMEELKKNFPDGLDYKIAFDTTPFVQESIDEVVRTLTEAVILVAIVVLVFLQSWRSTLIPLTAVPVAIVGTFAAMAVLGFSLNTLTLFGLVLAIGIVVDDAIVVVEAVEYHIEHGLSPRQAAHKAMEQVSGPVMAVALVLSAVFVPCAFLGGITGQFFRQFALTIAVSTTISAFNSLTLSPALAAILLQPHDTRKDVLGRLLDLSLGWFFRLFNWGFRQTTNGYTRLVGLALRGSLLVLLVYGGLLGLTWWISHRLPVGYIPDQDQARLFCSVQLPDAASLERTQKVMDHVADIFRSTPGVDHVIAVSGMAFSLGANGSNFGNLFITLKPFAERAKPYIDEKGVAHSLYSTAITDRLRVRISQEILEAKVTLFGPPPVSGLGAAGGFKLMVQDRGDLGLTELEKQTQRLIEAGNKGTKVGSLFSVFRANAPQLYVDLDRGQCQTMGVNPRDVFSTLQIFLGSFYVNDFNKFGRTWQVVLQAKGQFRNDPKKVRLLAVRNDQGQMVPLGSILTVRENQGPLLLSRYNMYPAATVMGSTLNGVSSGEGIAAVEQLCAETLPQQMGFEWTEINWIQIDAARNIWNNLIFPLSVVFVFLVLAAQYESWALPLAVILVVPMCILGSLTGVAITHWDWLAARLGFHAAHDDINIFTQIGFVVLVGLASKNAILIVEFAKHKREEGGLPRDEATLAACQLRLRPILMTSFAFILGVVPLLISTGAGSEMRRTLGTAVFSGMLGVTLFGIFLTPVFFYVIEGFVEIPLFSSVRARQIGLALRLGLGIAFLGLPWLPGLLARRRQKVSRVSVLPRVPPANGVAAEGGQEYVIRK